MAQLSLILAVALVTKGNAQTSGQTAAPSKPADSDTLVLSPFEVRSDPDSDSYRVDSTTTGAKINTPLNELPVTINVLNRQFLEDAKVFRVQDAVLNIAGVTNSNRNEVDSETYTIRGFSTSTPLRNGVPFNSITDITNIDRVEIAKGPAAVLYGNLEPGGVVNYTTKKPLDRYFTNLTETVGNFSFVRTDMDINLPLNDKGTVLFRLPAAYEDKKSSQKFEESKTLFFNPVLTFRATPTTLLTFDYTYKKETGNFSRGGVIGVLYGNANFAQGTSIFNLPGFGFDHGTTFPGGSLDNQHYYGEFRLDQSLGKHINLQAIFSQDGSSYYNRGAFFNNFRTDAAAAVFQPTSLSQVYSLYYPFIETFDQKSRYYEIDALMRYDLGSIHTTTLLGMSGSHVLQSSGLFQKGFRDTPYTVDNTAPDSARFALPADITFDTWFPFGGGATPGFGPANLFVTEQVGALNNKLHVLAGLRHQYYSDIKEFKNLPQIGGIYQFSSGLSAYVSYSKTTRSNGNRISDGAVRTPEDSNGLDVGLKFDLFGSKVTGSVAYFDIQKKHIAVSGAGSYIDLQTGQIIPGADSVLLVGAAESKGFEADIQARPAPGVQLGLSYAHTNARTTYDTNTSLIGKPFPGAVPDSVVFYARVKVLSGFLKDFEYGGGLIYDIGSVHYDPFGSVFYGVYTKGDTYTARVFARYPVHIAGKEVLLGVSVNNLTDQRFFIRSLTLNDARQMYFSAQCKF